MGMFNIKFIDDFQAAGGLTLLKYFTVQSNVLAGVAAVIMAVYERQLLGGKREEIPKWAYLLKFISSVGVTVTFVTVAAFLAPFVAKTYISLYLNSNIFFHFLAPLLTFISFSFLELTDKISKKEMFLGLAHFLVYGVIYMIIAYTHLSAWVGGDPEKFALYNWYYLAFENVFYTLIATVLMTVITFNVSLVSWRINKKLYSKVGE